MPPNIQRGGGGGGALEAPQDRHYSPLPSTCLLTSNDGGGGALEAPQDRHYSPLPSTCLLTSNEGGGGGGALEAPQDRHYSPPPVHMPPNIQRWGGGGGGALWRPLRTDITPPLPSTCLLTSNDGGGGTQDRHYSLIRYRFSYPAIRYLPIPQNILRYDSIHEYFDQYIDIIILYTYFKQASTFLLTHKCNQNT